MYRRTLRIAPMVENMRYMRTQHNQSKIEMRPPTPYCNDWVGHGDKTIRKCDYCKDPVLEDGETRELTPKGELHTCSNYCMALLKRKLRILESA